MGNRLSETALELGVQSITGISTTLNDSASEIPTSGAIIDYLMNIGVLTRSDPVLNINN